MFILTISRKLMINLARYREGFHEDYNSSPDGIGVVVAALVVVVNGGCSCSFGCRGRRSSLGGCSWGRYSGTLRRSRCGCGRGGCGRGGCGRGRHGRGCYWRGRCRRGCYWRGRCGRGCYWRGRCGALLLLVWLLWAWLLLAWLL